MMGIDLTAANGKRACTGAGHWHDLLRKAEQIGWKPMGTVLTRDYYRYTDDDIAQWTGRYVSNDAQVILEEDALALASALRRMPREDYLQICLRAYEDLLRERTEPTSQPVPFAADTTTSRATVSRDDLIAEIIQLNATFWDEGLLEIIDVLEGGRVWIT